VKDYTLLYRRRGAWRELAKVTGNYQRLRRHRFDAVEAEAIRVHVTATQGD
jgi:hypothetical protein